MSKMIDEIISIYNPKNSNEVKYILKEIVQSIVLAGLSKSGFFEKASFYGGTALRIFYGINRYSEDLDFTLNEVDEFFSLEPYIEKIKEIGISCGLDLELSVKEKKNETPIESAFAKLDTYQTSIDLKMNDNTTKYLHKDEIIKVKFEVDCHPALGFKTETKWIDVPEFSPVIVWDEPSLFSGKIHAILCRNYKNQVKGRDYYDFMFFIKRRTKPNMEYLRKKLVESGKIEENDEFNINILKEMLIDRFSSVDYSQVINDTRRFIFGSEDVTDYSKDLFISFVERL